MPATRSRAAAAFAGRRTALGLIVLLAAGLSAANAFAYYRSASEAAAASDAERREWRATLAQQRAILDDKEPQLEQEYLDARAAYEQALAARRAGSETTLSLTNNANEMNAAYESDVAAVRKAHRQLDALERKGAPRALEVAPAPYLESEAAIAVLTLCALVAWWAVRPAA